MTIFNTLLSSKLRKVILRNTLCSNKVFLDVTVVEMFIQLPLLPALSVSHPVFGIVVEMFNYLRKNKFICCELFNSSVVCDFSVLGNHIKMPFFDSQTTTLMPFDILHKDLWTSPILGPAGHKYHVLFLDDFTNFLWTFLISRRSHMFETFKSLTQLIQTQFL